MTFGINEGFDRGPKMLIFLALHHTFPQSTHVVILISLSDEEFYTNIDIVITIHHCL